MDTKECCNLNSKRKKIILAFFIFAIGILALVVVTGAKWKMYETRNNGRVMHGYGNVGGFNGMMGKFGVENQFIIPEDAARSGEIALMVNDLEIVKKSIALLSSKNGGSVYSSTISYASDKLKNGSIVVQVPVEKFDSTFEMLKNVGTRVVQESSRQIPARTIYPMPLSTGESEKTVIAGEESSTETEDDIASSDQNEILSVSPVVYPSYSQPAQDKGYIRVVFVDYGKRGNADKFAGMMVSSDNVQKLWIGLGLKLLLLIVLLIILLILLRKIFQDFRAFRAAKKARAQARVHVVRQMPKTRSRVIKIEKRK